MAQIVAIRLLSLVAMIQTNRRPQVRVRRPRLRPVRHEVAPQVLPHHRRQYLVRHQVVLNLIHQAHRVSQQPLRVHRVQQVHNHRRRIVRRLRVHRSLSK